MKGPDGELEQELYARGFKHLAGVDEAGRGPLAGPLVAAAVIFKEIPALPLKDSKLIAPELREKLAKQIKKLALDWAVGIVSVKELYQVDNMHLCSLLAMRRALARLKFKPDFVLVDGKFLIPGLKLPQQAFIKGDNRSFFIAAASILAKVKRDGIMQLLDKKYPGYGFARHNGYGTREHFARLFELGPCAVHRKNFAPLKKLCPDG